MTTILRLPKWLERERFEISYDPTAPGRFVVSLLDESGTSKGIAPTVALAAKRALARRNQRGRKP